MNTETFPSPFAAHPRSCLFALLGAACWALSACSSPLDDAEESPEESLAEKVETLTRVAVDAPAIAGVELPSTPGPGPLPIVGGTFEPNYKYPWVVRLNGCAGVLIDPGWVLTAAHCVTPHIGFSSVSYTRTDSYGNVETDTRAPDPYAGSVVNPGVFIHPEYDPSRDYAADIALIKLAQPFWIDFGLQTVGLPRSFRTAGTPGVLASIDHTGTPPPGQTATFHGPIPSDTYAPKFNVTANAAQASLCPGDSGSGFVTVESGRATVRGIASQASVSDCVQPFGEATFTDVYAFRSWILETLGKDDVGLTGNTRVRRTGLDAHGQLVLGCSSPNTPYWGPLDVPGVEEGADCSGGVHAVICALDEQQASTRWGSPQITSFAMTTTLANGTTEVSALPFVSNYAQFVGALPAGASREFRCQIGSSIVNLSNAAVQMARAE